MVTFVECQCGEDAPPSNWFIAGIGRLWYCFNCLVYLDKDGKQIPPEVESEKVSRW